MMKALVVAVLILAICQIVCGSTYQTFKHLHRGPPLPLKKSLNDVKTKYIMQKVDNFDQQSPKTWSMRYMTNDEHYKPGGPLMIFVGGEWAINAGSIQGGHIYDMAKEFGGYLLYSEHRYYGLSHPTPSTSTPNLRYLNVDQALADLANLIHEMKATIPGANNSGVILVGGSYSATMVTWFRQKYPHLVNGAWASSAPLLAKPDFIEYKEVVSEGIKLLGTKGCSERIESAISKMEKLIAANDTAQIETEFKLCPGANLNNELDAANFFSTISDTFAGIMQYHRNKDIEWVCMDITDETITDDITALASWFVDYWTFHCFDISYDLQVKFYEDSNWNSQANEGGRQWFYQTCAEYGWYQTSGSDKQIFGSSFPIKLYTQMCTDIYNQIFTAQRVDENARRTNIIYGEMNPAVTNVFFTHGQLDPWRPMGIQTDLNADSPAVVIPLVAHCADLGSISAADSEEMKKTKMRITEHVKMWLKLK